MASLGFFMLSLFAIVGFCFISVLGFFGLASSHHNVISNKAKNILFLIFNYFFINLLIQNKTP